jgi:hypothetical protein
MPKPLYRYTLKNSAYGVAPCRYCINLIDEYPPAFAHGAGYQCFLRGNRGEVPCVMHAFKPVAQHKGNWRDFVNEELFEER